MNGTSGRKIDEDRTRSDVREQQQRKDKRKDDKEVMTDKKKERRGRREGYIMEMEWKRRVRQVGNCAYSLCFCVR